MNSDPNSSSWNLKKHLWGCCVCVCVVWLLHVIRGPPLLYIHHKEKWCNIFSNNRGKSQWNSEKNDLRKDMPPDVTINHVAGWKLIMKEESSRYLQGICPGTCLSDGGGHSILPPLNTTLFLRVFSVIVLPLFLRITAVRSGRFSGWSNNPVVTGGFGPDSY